MILILGLDQNLHRSSYTSKQTPLPSPHPPPPVSPAHSTQHTYNVRYILTLFSPAEQGRPESKTKNACPLHLQQGMYYTYTQREVFVCAPTPFVTGERTVRSLEALHKPHHCLNIHLTHTPIQHQHLITQHTQSTLHCTHFTMYVLV